MIKSRIKSKPEERILMAIRGAMFFNYNWFFCRGFFQEGTEFPSTPLNPKTNLFYIEYSKASLEEHSIKEVISSVPSSHEEKKPLFSLCPIKYCLHLSFSTNEEAMNLFDQMQNV